MGTRYALCRDYRGILWDALLYVPTVTMLLVFATSNWYATQTWIAYLLGFMACFFFIAGTNRILVTRLMWLPSAPVAIETASRAVALTLKSGRVVNLIGDVKLYRDRSGNSFGLTGSNGEGKRYQYIFHRRQFGNDEAFAAVMDCYDPVAKTKGKV